MSQKETAKIEIVSHRSSDRAKPCPAIESGKIAPRVTN
jgi:hypothetical protein